MTSETKRQYLSFNWQGLLGRRGFGFAAANKERSSSLQRAHSQSATGTSSVTRSAEGGRSLPPKQARVGGLVSTAASEFNRVILNYLLYRLHAAFIFTMSGVITWRSTVAECHCIESFIFNRPRFFVWRWQPLWKVLYASCFLKGGEQAVSTLSSNSLLKKVPFTSLL